MGYLPTNPTKFCQYCNKPLRHSNRSGVCQTHWDKSALARQTAKAWRDAHSDQVKASAKKSRDKHKEKIRARQREHYAANKERINASRNKERSSWNSTYRKFGLTADDYAHMLLGQNGQCAICGRTDPGRKTFSRLCVDHCHRTGFVRGLLCAKCNRGIGCFADRVDLVTKAMTYLQKSLEQIAEKQKQPTGQESSVPSLKLIDPCLV